MLKKCLCCFNLHMGSLMVGLLRLTSWLFIFVITIFISIEVFVINSSMVHFQPSQDIERNSHVPLLILLVSLIGILLECLLLHGLWKRKYKYFKLWYAYTFLAFVFSILLALNFLMGILEIPSRPSTGKNFVMDGLCVLFQIVFYLLPSHLGGPRLEPVMVAVVILVHIALPFFHFYSGYVVYSYLHTYILDDRGRPMTGHVHSHGNGDAPMAAASAPMGVTEAGILSADGTMVSKTSTGKKCGNCAHKGGGHAHGHAQVDGNGMLLPQHTHHHQQGHHHHHHHHAPVGGVATPLLNIETTC